MKKYQKGNQIKSLNELMECDFVYYTSNLHLVGRPPKIIHKSYWQNWSFRTVLGFLNSGYFYKAEPQEWYKQVLSQSNIDLGATNELQTI